MRLFRVSALSLLISSPFFLAPDYAGAGSYIFATEDFGVDYVVHPQNYSGSEDVVTVRVCIDPNSPNATDMEYSVKNNIAVYNQLAVTTGNIKLGGSNNVPSDAIDFESVALHEVGHCLGMAHINAASESGLLGNNTNYTKATDGADNSFNINAGADGVIGSSDDSRGDDINLVWFRTSNNDPFTIDSVIDSTTYSRNVTNLPVGHSFAANADRAVSTLLDYPKTEAVMQQGTYYDEAQRTLGHDDVATLRYASSGKDERESGGPGGKYANDNYTIVLEYGGISSAANCDINMSLTDTPGLAFCEANGVVIGSNHASITTANIEFGQEFNWFFNSNVAPVLSSIGNINVIEGANLEIIISATDAENGALSFSDNGTPSFVSMVDNGDGTATLTIVPAPGDAASVSMTVTVADDVTPALTDSETFMINVAVLDSDGDGLSDYSEINQYMTNPNLADTDGDFVDDGVEISNVIDPSDPLDPLDWPNFADGDIAPLGAPDGLINAADYLIAQRIVLGEIAATSLELSHADLHPVGAPDGVIGAPDLILFLQLIQQ